MGLMSKFVVNTATDMAVNTAKNFAVTTATTVAVKSIGNILGMPDVMVNSILAVGVPMMIMAGGEDPSITDRLFGQSKKKDRKKDKGRKEAEGDFFNIFGDKGHAMNKAIAEETGATEDQVNGVMGLFLPTFVDGIAEEEPEDAGALNKMFKQESEEVKKSSPSLARMAMKAMF
jgi:hypothetical protein